MSVDFHQETEGSRAEKDSQVEESLKEFAKNGSEMKRKRVLAWLLFLGGVSDCRGQLERNQAMAVEICMLRECGMAMTNGAKKAEGFIAPGHTSNWVTSCSSPKLPQERQHIF